MSLTEEQLRLKEEGNTALQAGDAARALGLFSEAIDLEGGSSNGRAILFSNRSAAYMLVKDHQSALEDAESCIRLDADFAKGWARKAAALHALGKFDQAAEFYRAAATKAKSPDQAEEYNKQADRCNNDKTNASAPRQAAPSASYTQSSSSASDEVYTPAVLALRVVSILMAIAWLVTSDSQIYAGSMLALGVSSVIRIIEHIGRPKFSAVYAERFLSDPTKPMFMLPFVFASMAPVFPGVTASQLIDIGPLARNVHRVLLNVAPGAANNIAERAKNSVYLSQALGVPEWAALSTKERFSRFNGTMERICSRFELAVMLVLILMMFTPSGHFVWLLVYAQVLKLRYITNEPLRSAVHNLDAYVGNLASRQPVALTIYERIRQGFVWFGRQGVDNVNARRSNPMANCTIM